MSEYPEHHDEVAGNQDAGSGSHEEQDASDDASCILRYDKSFIIEDVSDSYGHLANLPNIRRHPSRKSGQYSLSVVT